MRKLSMDELQKLALRKGAQLRDGSSVFNSTRAKLAPSKPTPAPVAQQAPKVAAIEEGAGATQPMPVAPPAPPALPAPAVNITALTAELDAKYQAQLDSLREAILAIPAPEPAAQAVAVAAQEPNARSWRFAVGYDPSGKVAAMDAKPTDLGQPAQPGTTWKFSVEYDKLGAITSVVAAPNTLAKR